eukprot:6214563-Pleurochrysis_carterae.AAC.6
MLLSPQPAAPFVSLPPPVPTPSTDFTARQITRMILRLQDCIPLHFDVHGVFQYLNTALLQQRERASRVNMLPAENAALRGEVGMLRAQNRQLHRAVEGAQGEVKRHEPVYNGLIAKRRKDRRGDIMRRVSTAVAVITTEVSQAEAAEAEEQKQRANLEKRVHSINT